MLRILSIGSSGIKTSKLLYYTFQLAYTFCISIAYEVFPGVICYFSKSTLVKLNNSIDTIKILKPSFQFLIAFSITNRLFMMSAFRFSLVVL